MKHIFEVNFLLIPETGCIFSLTSLFSNIIIIKMKNFLSVSVEFLFRQAEFPAFR